MFKRKCNTILVFETKKRCGKSADHADENEEVEAKNNYIN